MHMPILYSEREGEVWNFGLGIWRFKWRKVQKVSFLRLKKRRTWWSKEANCKQKTKSGEWQCLFHFHLWLTFFFCTLKWATTSRQKGKREVMLVDGTDSCFWRKTFEKLLKKWLIMSLNSGYNHIQEPIFLKTRALVPLTEYKTSYRFTSIWNASWSVFYLISNNLHSTRCQWIPYYENLELLKMTFLMKCLLYMSRSSQSNSLVSETLPAQILHFVTFILPFT